MFRTFALFPLVGICGAAAQALTGGVINQPTTGAPSAPGITVPKAGDTVEIPIAPECTFQFVYIPAGDFKMGTNSHDGGFGDERPAHRVSISKGYWIGKSKVDNGQWNALMPNKQSRGKSRDAVGGVSWSDCQEFIDHLNSMNIGTFRLPTEAEWEYACRAGGDGVRYFAGNGYDNYFRATKPNNYKISDMLGANQEWCQDWYAPYKAEAQVDPAGPPNGSKRVVRGIYVVNQANGINMNFKGVFANLRDSLDPEKRKASVGFRFVAEDNEKFNEKLTRVMD